MANGNGKEKFIIKEHTRKQKRTYKFYCIFHASACSKVFLCWYVSDLMLDLFKKTNLKFYYKIYNIYRTNCFGFITITAKLSFFLVFFFPPQSKHLFLENLERQMTADLKKCSLTSN